MSLTRGGLLVGSWRVSGGPTPDGNGGLESKVPAGENAGATLSHEFVALATVAGLMGHELKLPRPIVTGVTRYALAAWVTRPASLVPLQATGGWLP